VTALNFLDADEGDVTTEKNNDRATMTNAFFCIFLAEKEFIRVSIIYNEPKEIRLNFKARILLA
tara:strand:- start:311 stop:502 length:192 start_codon:yes stop_codon:yes gene_type:complete